MLSIKSHLAITLLLALIIEISSQENLCKNNAWRCSADREEPWTYRGLKGPWFWGLTYGTCYGQQQSPIDIRTSQVEMDENLAQLELENYEIPVTEAAMVNNGHTIQVTPGDEAERSVSIDGKTYTLSQFHFHWGCDKSKGSEHAVDGKYYAMELHFVHVSEDNEIAVVGVFLDEQGESNEELQKIVDKLSAVRYKGEETELNAGLNLNNLVPANPTSYYRYAGSLTTPPCSQGVTWSVAPEPILVGRDQMEEFRKLYSATEDTASAGCRLSGNYRPVQPLNGRTVRSSQ